MIKRSTLKSIIIWFGAISCLGFAVSTMFWLSLISISETTAGRILCIILAVHSFTQAIGSFCDTKSRVQTRITNRRNGILEDPILSNHGATTSEVIRSIRNEPVEHIAYFTLDGVKVCEFTLNSPDETACPLAQTRAIKKLSGCMSIHNHPGDENIAFSPNDLRIAASSGEQRSFVVTKDIVFVMEMPKGCKLNPKKVYDVAMKAYKGNNYAERSLASCEAVAQKFGMLFYAIPFPDGKFARR